VPVFYLKRSGRKIILCDRIMDIKMQQDPGNPGMPPTDAPQPEEPQAPTEGEPQA